MTMNGHAPVTSTGRKGRAWCVWWWVQRQGSLALVAALDRRSGNVKGKNEMRREIERGGGDQARCSSVV